MTSFAKPWSRLLTGLLPVPLLLSLTGCASSPIVVVEATRCEYPVVAPETHAGLVRGLKAYHDALDLCNVLNGFPGPAVEGTSEAPAEGSGAPAQK